MWLAGLGNLESAVQSGWRRVKKHLDGLSAPRKAILDVSERPLVVTGSCHAALMFGSLEPDVGEHDVLTLAKAMIDLYEPGTASRQNPTICRDVPIEESRSRPWAQGYELAEEVHDYFDSKFKAADAVDVRGAIEALGIDVRERELSDENVRGAAIAGPDHRPGIVVNMRHAANGYESGYRFTLAHELCHILFDREAGNRLAIASGPWAPRDIERRANAFSAMFLMPTSLVRRVVDGLGDMPLASFEGVSHAVEKLGAGRESVLRHLTNLGFIDESDRQRLEKSPPEGGNRSGLASGGGAGDSGGGRLAADGPLANPVRSGRKQP